ncbi:MAG: TerB family tellurite resistance protein [Flavitalea sp.]
MSVQILEGYSTEEKTAYITAIASIATADSSASDLEAEYLANLGEAAGLEEPEQQKIIAAAQDTTGEGLKSSLDSLKASELRFSLIADLIAFAKSDNNFVEAEKEHIAAIANYLGVNDQQLEALNEYVQEAATQPAETLGFSGAQATGDASGAASMLGGLGIGNKLQSSGINIGSLTKGLISFIGPMILGNMLNKGLQGKSGATAGGGGLSDLLGSGGLGGLLGGSGKSGGGGLGDLLGGKGGGLGDLLGGGGLGDLLGGGGGAKTGGGQSGGLGSLIGGLSGGKGFGGIGGFLSNILKK